MKESKKNKITGKRFGVFLFYIIISIMIGKEFHPFTLVPMYNSFPNWSYVFSIKDESNEIIPIREYFDYLSGDFSHNFSALGQFFKIRTEYQAESTSELGHLGEIMLDVLAGKAIKQPEFDSIKLYRRAFYWEDNTIQFNEVFLNKISTESIKIEK